MADKKNVNTTGRRTKADIEARNKASYEGMVELYGLKGNAKKPASGKKK